MRPACAFQTLRLATSLRPVVRCSAFPVRQQWQARRLTNASATSGRSKVPDFAFAFDIDGVLLRASQPLPGASETLAYLDVQQIPFIFLTNGGGVHETERVERLNKQLGLALTPNRIVQSHTPFTELVKGADETARAPLENKCVLVIGGNGDKCRQVAESYGLKKVITPGDIWRACSSIWPFSRAWESYYSDAVTKPLPAPISPSDPSRSLRVDAVLIFNDPRDWALDLQILTDLLLSHRGILGTVSPANGRADLPNRGFLADGQPPIFVSNPDLIWAAQYDQPRLGQGAFAAALHGVWAALTDGASLAPAVHYLGKPHQSTYAFAERRLLAQRAAAFGSADQTGKTCLPATPLRTVYMIGDNPASDIAGGNAYDGHSAVGAAWRSLLVRTGVYDGRGEPAHRPTAVVDGVREAVECGLKWSGWK